MNAARFGGPFFCVPRSGYQELVAGFSKLLCVMRAIYVQRTLLSIASLPTG